ncbi:AbgT family transporter [Fusobacterium simiae]|uniref:AbgT family transporter n=1 Tax=Fusobacterium simiae TaxID=855 RepID=A0ABT4DNY2_FUSSI|nr:MULTISPECIES: AbgT family transporter [Fusobacterium]MCY7009076.1 AbgT family transporter [Fusobacterium simiae]MDC7955984.1 AbgT family transporter [Fusobacterium simiae]
MKLKKIKAPDAIVLIFILLIIISILTYIIPAGQYDRYIDNAIGREMVNPESYHSVENTPISLWNLLMSVPKGLDQAASIINFLFIIGGAFGILQSTGALDAFINKCVKKLQGRERLVIPFFLIFWALGGSILGNFEECLAFIPMQIMLCLALGFDSIVGLALGLCGVCVGYMGAIMNAFTIGIAQQIAGLPIYSGMGFRLIVWSVMLIAAIVYIWNYAGKIKKDPTKSLMYYEDLNSKFREQQIEDINFQRRHKLVLFIFLIGIIIIIFGVIKYGFYITEMGAVFVGLSVIMGLVGGLKLNGTVEAFIKGCHNLLYACMCVGFARALTIVMTDGKMLDVIVHSATYLLNGLPNLIKAPSMFIVQSIINILIPSGSGQAVVTMPIMVPIADVIGITRQTAVLAFQMGDGITNLFTPTSASLMAGLAIAGISWGKWMKWFGKLFLIWIIIGIIACMIATGINYGPF